MKVTTFYMIIMLMVGSMPMLIIGVSLIDFDDMNWGLYDTDNMKQEIKETWNNFKQLDCDMIKTKLDNDEFSRYQPHRMFHEEYLAEDYYTHECLGEPRIRDTHKFYNLRGRN